MPRKQVRPRKSIKDQEEEEENNNIKVHETDRLEKRHFRYFIKHELNFSACDGWDETNLREQMVKRREFMMWSYKANFFLYRIRLEKQVKAIRYAKRMQRVHLMSDQDQSGKGFKDLLQLLKSNKCMRGYVQGFEFEEKVNEKLKEFPRVLKRFTNLQNITLESGSEKGSQRIIQSLKPMRKFQNLHLRLLNDQITGQELQDLNKVVRRLPKLESFTLGCYWLDTPEFQRISEDFRKLRTFQRTRINFLNQRRLVDEELQKFSKDLEKFSCLQNFSLQLPNNTNITDKGIRALSTTLMKLNSVQRLDLIFFNCDEMTGKGIKTFSESFKGLTGLKSLNLGFDAVPKMKDVGMAQVGRGLAKLKSLRHINIYTSRCPEISDKGLQSLLQGLKKLEFLESFALKICSCQEEIENKGALALKETLKELKNLQRISLAFHNITGKGLEALAEALESAEKVKYLRLKFGEYLKITHYGMKMLVDTLNEMPCLGHVEIILASCNKVTEGKFLKLKQSLKGVDCEIRWNSRFFDGSLG